MTPKSMALVCFDGDEQEGLDAPIIETFPELDEVIKERSGSPESGIDRAFTELDEAYNQFGHARREAEQEIIELRRKIQRFDHKRGQISKIMGELERLGAKKILTRT